MRRRTLTVLLLLLVPAGARGRDPGGELRITSETSGDQIQPAVSMDRGGRFAVAWGSYGPELSGSFARLFSVTGVPLTGDIRVGPAAGDDQGPFSVSLDDAGFSVAWGGYTQRSGPNAYFRRFGRDGSPLSPEVYVGRRASPTVASDRQGRSIVLAEDGTEVEAWRFDRLGRPAGKPLPVVRFGAAPAVVRGLGGGFIAAWSTGTGIAGSLLDASGRPVVPFHVADTPALAVPSLAASPDGRFAVAWSSEGGLRLRLFRASGAPRTGVLRVTGGDPNYEGPISVAMDAAGRLLAVWSVCDPSFRACHVLGRRFHESGAPAGGPFRIDDDTYAYNGVAAAGPAGRFVVAWTRYTEETGSLIYGRLLTWALPGDAPCVRRGNRFLCDLAHGGEEERELSFGRGSDRPLLGDLDGDGRDDPCVYRDGRVLCDTAHDGGAAEVAIAFGQDGDVPLLADLDGEDRDDPCVRRGADLLCDSAHNGGTAELVVHFGEEDDLFLMGDVDGDGDDDPCVARSMLLCDTEHDGGAAETVIPLDRSGEAVLLGDLDDDGRDDPCLYEEGRFRCDADHDGTTELVISFGQPGDEPLLGDPAGL